MYRFGVNIAALVIFLGLPVMVQAADSDAVAVKVSIISSLSVDITEAELQLGEVNAGSSTISTAGVTVTNTGSGMDETYSLSLTDPSGWTASDTDSGVETYVLNAAFCTDGSAVSWDAPDHALSTTPVPCSGSQFSGDQTGVSVPHGETRMLWFQFLAPTATSVTTEQSIMVTVTAQAG